MATEINFDGLVGQTHNYAGLSYGNVASLSSAGAVSSPKGAALEGLAKMKALHDMGLMQGVLPPHARPHMPTLARMGFGGSSAERVARAYAFDPMMLAMASSASSMWVANAATVSPSADTADGRVHFTPANLQAKFHRSIEHEQTSRILRAVFPDATHFAHHEALPHAPIFGDEGAANHTRLCSSHGARGVEIFTWGRHAGSAPGSAPARFPARQTLEAARLIATSHGLDQEHVYYVQQSPEAIDAGVFHNDVIAVGSERVLLIHEHAWVGQGEILKSLDEALDGELSVIEVGADRVSIEDAVSSYLFNSQLVNLGGGRVVLICARECEEHDGVREFVEEMIEDRSNPIEQVRYFDLKQSMRNGGGPACLRLRVAVTEREMAAINPRCLLDEALYDELVGWVSRHYRDELRPAELADPALVREVEVALVELTEILDLGPIYPF